VRGSQHEIALVAILEAQQLGSILAPAARLLPQLARLHHRHHELERARAIHFLPHDALDLVQHAYPHRQPAVEACRQAPDEPRAQHELVTDDLRFGGGLLHGVDGVLREPHRPLAGLGEL